MTVKGFTDIGAGHKALTVDHDPRVVATDCPKGSLLVDSDGCQYRKTDDGATTNVVAVGLYDTHEIVIHPADDIEAILEAAADGDSFFLAPGVHEITGDPITITSKKGISIRGTKAAVVLHDNNSPLFNIQGCEDFLMEGFTLRVNITGSFVAMVTVENVGTGSYQRPTRHCYANLYFEQQNTGNCRGIDIQGDFLESVVGKCIFTGRFTSCIYMGSDSSGDDNSRSYVHNNICTTTYGTASAIRVRSDSGQGIFVLDNVISGPFVRGIEGSSQDALTALTISGNYIENVTGDAITVEHTGSGQVRVCNNMIYAPGGEGIYFKGSKSVLSGNIIHDAVVAGIHVTGSYNAITGNIITAGAASAIYLIAGAVGNVVEGNECTGPITNLGADNKINGKIENTVSTTDATVTTIATIPMPDDAASLLETSVTAFRTNGTDQAAYRNVSLSSRRSGGDCEIEGNDPVATPIESDGTWIISFAVSGTNILVRVKGASGKDINWKCRHTVESVA